MTIVGESAGGADVGSAARQRPAAGVTFHRAWAMSSSITPLYRDARRADEAADALLRAANVDDIAGLAQLWVAHLLEAQREVLRDPLRRDDSVLAGSR